VAPHPDPLPEGEGLVDKDNSMGSKISLRPGRGCAKKNTTDSLLINLVDTGDKSAHTKPGRPNFIKEGKICQYNYIVMDY